jgi:hypothetical protein
MSERMSDEEFRKLCGHLDNIIAEARRARESEARLLDDVARYQDGEAYSRGHEHGTQAGLRFKAERDAAMAVLALVQFSGSAHACPICFEFSADGENHSYYYGDTEPRGLLPGHAPDCRLAKALK